MWDSNIYWSSHRTTCGTEFITIVNNCQHSRITLKNYQLDDLAILFLIPQ